LIERKRDGETLSGGEIRELVMGFTTGDVPLYQMSAFAMAVFFQGMTAQETADLTRAMVESGEHFTYPDGAPKVVDKHSTGGVGDKVSLVLAPLIACGDVWVPMVSGRGLGITGGTLDKLESIPGFSVDRSLPQAVEQLKSIGVVMMGQTETFCPADRKLYALRDVTATVPSAPLIVASIMSKKIAESLDSLVLDIKFGLGAFMRTRREAEDLEAGMRQVADAVGLDFHAVLTPMDEPLGRAVGNALEVKEAIETLRGDGPPDLVELVLDLAEKVSPESRESLAGWLADGRAWTKFGELVSAQGGRTETLMDLGKTVHGAPVVRDVRAGRSGVVTQVDAERVGRTAVALGAGRAKVDDAIDPSVGFDQLVKTGSAVRAGDLLGRVHAPTGALADLGSQGLSEAVTIA
jgi:pyrimidine-nucleoside phosphorylase